MTIRRSDLGHIKAAEGVPTALRIAAAILAPALMYSLYRGSEDSDKKVRNEQQATRAAEAGRMEPGIAPLRKHGPAQRQHMEISADDMGGMDPLAMDALFKGSSASYAAAEQTGRAMARMASSDQVKLAEQVKLSDGTLGGIFGAGLKSVPKVHVPIAPAVQRARNAATVVASGSIPAPPAAIRAAGAKAQLSAPPVAAPVAAAPAVAQVAKATPPPVPKRTAPIGQVNLPGGSPEFAANDNLHTPISPGLQHLVDHGIADRQFAQSAAPPATRVRSGVLMPPGAKPSATSTSQANQMRSIQANTQRKAQSVRALAEPSSIQELSAGRLAPPSAPLGPLPGAIPTQVPSMGNYRGPQSKNLQAATAAAIGAHRVITEPVQTVKNLAEGAAEKLRAGVRKVAPNSPLGQKSPERISQELNKAQAGAQGIAETAAASGVTHNTTGTLAPPNVLAPESGAGNMAPPSTPGAVDSPPGVPASPGQVASPAEAKGKGWGTAGLLAGGALALGGYGAYRATKGVADYMSQPSGQYSYGHGYAPQAGLSPYGY
jgi:hypothetical protein